MELNCSYSGITEGAFDWRFYTGPSDPAKTQATPELAMAAKSEA
jgi:hypothetical protein